MRITRIKSLLSVLTLVALSPLCAASVIYDESVNGDIGYDSDFFILEENQNRISGSVSTGLSSDSDSFYFKIPSGFKANFSFLSSIDMGGSPYGISFSWELDRTPTPSHCSEICALLPNSYAFQAFFSGEPAAYLAIPGYESLPSISSLQELPEGDYRLAYLGSGGSIILGGSDTFLNYQYSMNYVADFNLQPVPLPGSSYFLISALIPLSYRLRRSGQAQ